MRLRRIFGVEIEIAAYLSQGGLLVYPSNPPLTYAQRIAWQSGGKHPAGQMTLIPGWKQVYDGTCGAELVSPPIDDTWSIVETIRRLKSSGIEYQITKACGLHIHVAVTDYEDSDLENLQKFYRHYSRTLYSFVDKDRAHNHYSQQKFHTDGEISSLTRCLQSANRYQGLNVQSVVEHGTAEFRLAEGTDDADRIIALAELYVGIVEFVKNNNGAFISSPKGTEKKRIHLLEISGVSDFSRNKLLNPKMMENKS